MEILFYLKEHLGKAILRSLLFVISLLSSQLVFADTSCFPREGLTAEQIADQERLPPQNFRFTTQKQIDNFQNDNGPCDIAGTIDVLEGEITNLDGLSNLRVIRSFTMFNTLQVKSLAGLRNWERTWSEKFGTDSSSADGALTLNTNLSLQFINLPNLSGGLRGLGLASNPELISVQLPRVNEIVDIGISNNYKLTLVNLEGLSTSGQIKIINDSSPLDRSLELVAPKLSQSDTKVVRMARARRQGEYSGS